MSKIRFFVVLFLILFGVMQTVQATEYGDIVVTLQSPVSGQSAHGYAEYRVSVANRSAAQRHVVTLNLPDPRASYNRGEGIQSIARTVVVEPKSTAAVSLWQPSMPLNGPGGLGVEIDGRLMKESVPGEAAQQMAGGYGGYNAPFLLQSQGISKTGLQGLFTDALKILSDEARKLKESAAAASTVEETLPANATGDPAKMEILDEVTPWLSYNGSLAFSFSVSDTAVAEWSPNWLSYSRYDGIFITGDELRDMPPPVKAALWRAVEAGGALFILGSGDPPPEWKLRKRLVGVFSAYDVGFGQCLFTNRPDVKDIAQNDWFALWKTAQSGSQFWNDRLSAQDANEKFPVIEKLSIPLRGLFLFILAFTLVIGPANFLILRKLNRRMWLLWTVPALSLLTSIGVSAYAIFSEGFKGYTRIAGFTILNEPARQATTIGIAAYYAPLTPGDGLHFTQETELTPQTMPYLDGAGLRTLDWTTDQHFQQGWVSARVPAHFQVRKSEVRRERLTVQYAPDGGVSVLNGLGAPITSLALYARDGKLYSGANIAAGARAPLSLLSEKPSPARESLRALFTREWMIQAQNFSQDPHLILSPNTYLAVLDGASFIEDGLANADVRTKQSFIYGLIREGGDEN